MATLGQLERFCKMVAVDRDGPLTNGQPCWMWQGTCLARKLPYGTLWIDGKRWLAHRWFYISLVGDAPYPEKELDHVCRRAECVNPRHLDLVSHRTNVRRGAAAETQRALKLALTHCKHGHEFTPENTHINAKGHRSCFVCRRAAMRRSYRRRNPEPARQTHCKRGHPLFGANLFLNSEGRRVCRTCKRVTDRVNQQRYRDRKKAA